MGNALATGMGIACLNSAVIGQLMSGGKCEITGVEISTSLLAVSLNPLCLNYNRIPWIVAQVDLQEVAFHMC